jgi:hypothetical protein
MDKLTAPRNGGAIAPTCRGSRSSSRRRKVRRSAKLGDPSITKDDDVRKLRQDIFVADVSIDTLAFAIGLPAAILQGREEADKFIRDFEKKNETTGNAQP